ncbi:phosphotransferase [Sagittula sp. M10.9X]|uniref:Phosphotransferase n=1 Tax=Sagittula salina TaxID=2820268 RepID=A0A940MR39_9RHOB|nr:phosphotransferase [Sagittula salina]
MDAFLHRVGWDGALAEPLAGDASGRSYSRLLRAGGESAILMQDPTGDTGLFARIARHLTARNLSAPLVLAEADGLLLLEDLGDALFARLAVTPEIEQRLYLTAVEALVKLHATPAPATLPVATPDHLAQAIDLAFCHYAQMPALLAEAVDTFRPLLAEHAPPEDVMVLRDFHAENLLLLEGRTGAARAGLLDFQDALMGNTAYDLVSLCRDVRRDVRPETEAACIQAYLDATGADPQAFRAAYAVLGVQRNLRILGVFSRLAVTRGKTRYLEFLPRTWSHIQAQMMHPALEPLRPIISQLPPPDAPHIQSILSRCP